MRKASGMHALPAILVLLPALLCGQAVSDVMLVLDFDKVVWYVTDPSESGRWLTAPAVTPVPQGYSLAFRDYLLIGDLVAVNSKPAKGAMVARGKWVPFTAADPPAPKQAISDIGRTQLLDILIQVHDVESGQVAILSMVGFGGGSPPFGTPPGSYGGAFLVTGGSGAWSGARGQAATVAGSNFRNAPLVEDPAYRRVNGGGKWSFGVTLHSMTRPTIVGAYHSDFSPVTQSRPARGGEELVLAVRGLGPTQPVLVPGKKFEEEPIARVAAPVSATAGGQPASVVNRVGWPGTDDTYRVDLVLPSGLTRGNAATALTAAFISGPEYLVPIQ